MSNSLNGYQAACEGAALFRLSELGAGVVEVSGPDAPSFLQNLCTNDVKNLASGAGCEAFFCTAKARVVAHVLVSVLTLQEQKAFWLDVMPGPSSGPGKRVLDHLNHFLISEQVELAERADITLLRLCGPLAESMLAALGVPSLNDLPPLHHVSWPMGPTTVVRIRRNDLLGLPGFDMFCAPTQAEDVAAALTSRGVVPAGAVTHETLRIEAGLPAYGLDMDENRFVVEVGRVKQAISYTKGCYLGQEPIVMARDRGHVNRTLMGVTLAGTTPLPAGTRLFRDSEEAGQTTSSVYSPRLGKIIALAYLRRGSQAPGTQLQLESDSAVRTAEVAVLPFFGIP